MEKFVRRHSELPVDAPLSATDGFLWSRLELPQGIDELARATGLPPEAVEGSLDVLEKAGLIERDGAVPVASTSSVSSPSTSSSAELARLIELGHRLLNSGVATSHWPELGESRERAFETFRLISRVWLDRFKGVRGPERIEGEKLLSRLRRLRDSAPHKAEATGEKCIWLFQAAEFSSTARGLIPNVENVHPGVAAGARTVVSAGATGAKKATRAVRPARADAASEMDKRRAQIEARRRESIKPTASAPATSAGVNSGAHKVAGLDAHTLYNKAVSAFAQGLVEESARAIQLALAMTPEDPKLQALDAEVTTEWKRQRAHKLAKQAANDWTVGLIEPAVNKIVEAADLVPDYASIAAQAADYCLLTGKLELAVEFADRAVVNAPSRLDYRLTAAAAFYAAGDVLVAKEQLAAIKSHIEELESRPDD